MSKKPRQYTYKNISGKTQALIGVGEFAADEKFTTNEEITNPNFELLGSEVKKADDHTDQDEGQEPAENSQDVSSDRPASTEQQDAREGEDA